MPQAYSLATPHVYHLRISLLLYTPAAFHQQIPNLAHMGIFKFKSSKKGSSGDQVSGQSGSGLWPGSSHRSVGDILKSGSRTPSPSPAVEKSNTPDAPTASQMQTDSASIHTQPGGSYSEIPILQMHKPPHLVTF